MLFTKYQTDIFDAISARSNGTSEGNLIIQACPGGSKTTTLIESCRYINDWQKVILLSFNRHIAEELGSRLYNMNLKRIESSTLNALGWRACRNNVKGLDRVDTWKDINILRGIVSDKKEFEKIKWTINKLIGLCKAYVIGTSDIGKAREIADMQGIEIPTSNFFDIFEQCYMKSIREINKMSFDDQIYMPVVMGWGCGNYDFSMVDESQDLSLMNMELIKLLGGTHIFVGDKYQACYLFRGAAGNSMDIIKKEFSCTEMPLSICFRCPEMVIEEARKIYSSAIESPSDHGMENTNGIGIMETVSKDVFRELVDINDFVLCRTNAPLIKECLRMLPYKPCFVRGREIGEGLVKLIDLVVQINTGVADFNGLLESYASDMIRKLNKLNKEMEASQLQDQVDSLQAFMMLVNNTDDMKNLINKVIPSKGGDNQNFNQDKVCFMSLHRSKGLETKNVWILRRDLIPHSKAKTEDQITQEWNLLFIGITRARASLRYVSKERGE